MLYRQGRGEFALPQSPETAPSTVSQMAFEVDNHRNVVAELKQRGVAFENVDLPGLRTTEGVAEVEGNKRPVRPSRASPSVQPRLQ